MAKYMTKQRKILLDFLEEHPTAAYTAHQIAEALGGESISVSAVYRNLAELAEEGRITKCTQAGSREICYRSLRSTGVDQLFMSCRKCGRTYHESDRAAAALLEALAASRDFSVDQAEVVLVGCCHDCRQAELAEGVAR